MPRLPLGYGKEDHFVKRGHQLKGVVHVGMNDGEEITWYAHIGRLPVLAFEPNPEVWAEACSNYAAEIERGDVRIVNIGLGDHREMTTLKVVKTPAGAWDTKGASVLGLVPADKAQAMAWPPQQEYREVPVDLWRFDDWVDLTEWDVTPYNVLVIDVQGMELQVLQGFGEYLQFFPFIMAELSADPFWEGEASGEEVSAWLAEKGWRRDSPIVSHNDVMFIKEGA